MTDSMPKARPRDVILGAMEELLLLMQANDDADDNDEKPANAVYIRRFRQLMDELKRSPA